MAKIEHIQAFTMPRDELEAQLDNLASELGEELQLECEWLSDDCLDFRRSGAKGQINIGADEIELTVKLGLLLRPFRGNIEQKMLEYLDEHIY